MSAWPRRYHWRHKCSRVPFFRCMFSPASSLNFDLGPSSSDCTKKISIKAALPLSSRVFKSKETMMKRPPARMYEAQCYETIETSKRNVGLSPPPPTTTLIPHIEVGFKWMWTQLATPNKMAPAFVDLCAGLVVLLPRQICRFRHGFFSSAVLDWSLRSCLRVRHLWRQQIADNRRYLRRSFLPWTSSLRSQISLSKRW